MSAENSTDSTNDQQRPFLGLRSFEEGNKGQFGGRDDEINELFEQIEDNGLTVVFGKSGIGKTSLLRAGLIPRLRQKFFFPIYIRIDYSAAKSPLEQVREQVYHAMHEKDSNVTNFNKRSLWQYFHDVNFSNGLVTPVLILDQFEEIFTLGEENAGVDILMQELSDMAENRIPLAVQNEYKNKEETVPANYSSQPYRVVFSLREDFLPRLEELKKFMPTLMDSRFRVVQMTISQAMDAAIKPGKGLIDEPVAKAIIKKLPGISDKDFALGKQKANERQNLKVEPFLLSFICDRINEERIKKGLKTFDVPLVEAFEVKDAIRSFYNETLAKYDLKVEHGIEDLLLTQGGFRKLQALGELQSKYFISDEIIDELVEARILRKENRESVDYVELIHDVLTPVIREKRDKRLAEEEELARLEDLKIERAKNRKRLIQIGSILGVILVGIILFAAYQNALVRQNEEQKVRKARARELMLSAISMSIYKGTKTGSSALLAKAAYGIYKMDRDKVKGINESDRIFYSGMLMSTFDIGYKNRDNFIGKFQEISSDDGNDNTIKGISSLRLPTYPLKPQSLARIDHLKSYLVSLKDKSLRTLTLEPEITIAETPLYSTDDYEHPVTAMAYDSVQEKLALVRDKTIYLHGSDISRHEATIEIPVDSNERRSRSRTVFLNFMPDSSMSLAMGDKLFRWDKSYTNAMPWQEKEIFKWRLNDSTLVIENDTQEIKTTQNILAGGKTEGLKGNGSGSPLQVGQTKGAKEDTTINKDSLKNKILVQPSIMIDTGLKNKDWEYQIGENSLTFPDKILGISVSSKGMIAIAIGYTIYIINNDQLHEIAYRKWRKINTLKFDPKGEMLLVADEKGGMFSFEIPANGFFDGIAMQRHFAHNKKILSFAFNHAKPNLFASCSMDGTVAIWDMKDWSALMLDATIYKLAGVPVREIVFSKKGGFLIAAYDDASIIRWPSSLEKIDKMICDKVEEEDLQRRLPKIIKSENKIVDSDSIYYCCNCEELLVP